MSDIFNIYKSCETCNGTGKIQVEDDHYDVGPPYEVDCNRCNGTGKILWGFMEEATNVFDSYLILEAIDATEYNALTDVQKDGVNILLSCGKIDLNTGKVGRVRLWSWFGAESTTVANLTALLEE